MGEQKKRYLALTWGPGSLAGRGDACVYTGNSVMPTRCKEMAFWMEGKHA